jgi:uncharacterized membrane protein
VSTEDWLLLFHLVGAFAFVSGLVVATFAYFAARSLEHPAEIAAVLRLARSGVVLVGAGAVLVLAFGLWLAGHLDVTGRAWVSASLGLFVAAVVLGAVGGQAPKRARKLATRLSVEGAAPTEELNALLHDRVALAVNALGALAVAAILVLMVWRPGS